MEYSEEFIKKVFTKYIEFCKLQKQKYEFKISSEEDKIVKKTYKDFIKEYDIREETAKTIMEFFVIGD